MSGERQAHYLLCHLYSDAWWWQLGGLSDSRDRRIRQNQEEEECSQMQGGSQREIAPECVKSETGGEQFTFKHNNCLKHRAKTTL